MAESKRERESRLKKEGRWDAFVSEREQLKSEGKTAAEATELAAAQFPPLVEEQLQEIKQGRMQAEDERQKQQQKESQLLMRLVAAAAGREASERDVVSWVFENAPVPADQLDVDTIPSPGAIGLWQWVRISATHYTEFVKSVWSKLLPSRAQIDSNVGLTDDGRHLLSHLAELDRELAAAGSEGFESEYPVPDEAAAEGESAAGEGTES